MEANEKFDLNNAQAPGRWLKIAGTYQMQITEAKSTYSKNKGTPGITYTMKDAEGNMITDTFFTTESALWRFNIIADAAGLPKERREAFAPNDVVGCTVEIDVDSEADYPDNMKVKAYRKTDTVVVAPAADDMPF